MLNSFLKTLVLILFSINISAQDIYILTPFSDIYQLNPDSSLTYITTADQSLVEVPFTDIAISPSKTFYGIAGDRIVEINIQDGSTTLLATFSTEPGTAFFGAGNSLTCSDNYELYTIDSFSGKLIKYDISNDSSEFVADLGFNTPGDLTFYKGNIIFPTLDQSNSTDEFPIMAFNLETHELVKIFCFNNNRMLGMANVFESCNTSEIIGATEDELFKFDFQNQVISSLGIDLNDQFIYGIASDNEYSSSNCSFNFADAECLTSSNYHPNGKSQELMIYPNPTENILHFKSENLITSLELFDLSGRLINHLLHPKEEINLSNLNSGIYVLKFYSENGVLCKKVIKK